MTTSTIATDIKRPFIVKAINTLGRLLKRFNIELISLDDGKLLKTAKKTTGLTDFGGDEFREGFHILMKSLREEAELNTIGRMVAYNSILVLLQNRLQIAEHLKRHPNILKEEITAPFVIAGLPRTGTTILQSLLSAVPGSRTMMFWECARPCPPLKGKDNRLAQNHKEMDAMLKFVPGFNAIHPIGAEYPQECLSFMAINFTSVQFELNFNVPSYQKWYNEQDLVPTMEYHKKCLQILQYYGKEQGKAEKQWVLKTPPYVSAVESVLAVYPDARVIQTHRDPSNVVLSVSSLYYALHALSCDTTTPKKIAAAQLENWSNHLNKSMQARTRLAESDTPIYDLYFEQLLDNPVAEIKRVYEFFNIEWTQEIESTLNKYMSENGREKHGKHSYTKEMFGLVESDIEKHFSDYYQRFDVTRNSR